MVTERMNMPSKPAPIPLCEPRLDGREREYVTECLATGWVSSAGSFVNRFEEQFADRLGVPEAVAVASGTAALHLALLACGIQPGEEVLVPTLTFIAPANAIRYVGAFPVFVDAEPDTWQMDLESVAEFLGSKCRRTTAGTIHLATGRRVSAILPVHILGCPVDMDRLMEIAAAHDLKVIEDSTESLGATCRGRATGTIGHAGCFSFNGNKLITTGGGGMVVSHDPEILQTVRHLSTQAKKPGNEYIHDKIGFNYRLTNIQAALGCAQLEQLGAFLEKKRRIAATYLRDLDGIDGIRVQREPDWACSAWWLFTILVGRDCPKGLARSLINQLAAEGISSRPLWQPMHLSAAHAGSFALPAPVSEQLFETGVSLPSSVSLDVPDQQRITRVLRDWAAGTALQSPSQSPFESSPARS